MKKPLTFLLFLSFAFFAQAQKMVVFEKFTNMRCGQCPNAALMVKDVIADHPNTIWLSHHKPYEGNPLTNPISDSLWYAMEVPGPPIGMVDRKIVDAKILSYSGKWRDRIAAQAALDSPVDINITEVDFDATTHILSFEVEAIFNTIPGPGPHNLTAYILEDSISGRQNSYYNEVVGHPLEGAGDPIWGYWHRHVVRTILDDLWGSAGVIPDTPEINTAYSKSYSYQVPGSFVPSRMSIVATVSKFNEQDNTDRLIYNGAKYELRSKVSGTKNLDTALDIVIAPNPAREYLELNFNKLPEELLLVDVTGRTIREFSNIAKTMRVELDGLNSGLYYLIAHSGAGVASKVITIIP